MKVVIETEPYLEAPISERDRVAIKDELAVAPEKGVPLPDTCGLRIARFSVDGGEIDVVTYYATEIGKVFLLTVIDPGDDQDLTDLDRRFLAKRLDRVRVRHRPRLSLVR